MSSMKISPLYPLAVFLAALAYATLTPFNFRQVNRAAIGPDGDLVFTGYSTAYPLTPPAKLARCDSFTIILRLQTGMGGGQGCILDYAVSDRSVNMRIEQWRSDLLVSISHTGGRRRAYLSFPKAMKPGVPVTAVVFFDGHTMSGWEPGGPARHGALPPGTRLAWDSTAALSLGSTVNGKFDWCGSIRMLTIFDRILTLDDLIGGPPGPGTPQPLLSYEFPAGVRTPIHDAGRPPAADLVIPERALAPRRELLESVADYWQGPNEATDVFLNILVFVPLGYLTTLFLRMMIRRPRAAFMLAFAAVFLCSLSIEVAQHFLPTRNSSMMDVLSNTIGGIAGIVLGGREWPARLLASLGIELSLDSPLAFSFTNSFRAGKGKENAG
jgi:VanZ family protein